MTLQSVPFIFDVYFEKRELNRCHMATHFSFSCYYTFVYNPDSTSGTFCVFVSTANKNQLKCVSDNLFLCVSGEILYRRDIDICFVIEVNIANGNNKCVKYNNIGVSIVG